jgi:hypothetical protein
MKQIKHHLFNDGNTGYFKNKASLLFFLIRKITTGMAKFCYVWE